MATHADFGLVTFEVMQELLYFPEAPKLTITVTIDYLCPAESYFEVVAPMPLDHLSYDVTSQENLYATLSTFDMSACFQVARQYFLRADTGQEVDYIDVIKVTN